ncbi:hypothetical protein [Bacillus sp. NPDC094106]|uniref:hypothetical protein n=1 Tax=Bacillus sp. NPDC094106 TaxID=3363949 RepID=UPI00382B28FF
MEFTNLTEKGMERVVSQLVDEQVIFQMEDTHACYFDGVSGRNEYKVIIDHDEPFLNEREQGNEDWNPCFGIEISEEVIESIL